MGLCFRVGHQAQAVLWKPDVALLSYLQSFLSSESVTALTTWALGGF